MAEKKQKCECKPIVGILGVILMTLGIFSLVEGFKLQINSAVFLNWNALLGYLIGVLLLGFGMIAKHKGYAQCKMHSM